MSLRRSFNTIGNRGNWEFATVISVENGRATVYLSSSKRTLTNLPIVGDAILAGQTVVVDYSASTPIVRRFVAAETDTWETPVLSSSSRGSTTQVPRIDIGCQAGLSYYYIWDDYAIYYIPTYTDHTVIFGLNDSPYYDIGESASMWDTSNFVDRTSRYGREYVVIPVTGRYYTYIHYHPDFIYWNYQIASGGIRVRAIKNGTTPVLEAYGISSVRDGRRNPDINASDIISFEEGDQVGLEIRIEWDDANPGGYYGIVPVGAVFTEEMNIEHGWTDLILQLAPGTEAVIVDPTEEEVSCLSQHPGYTLPTDISDAEIEALCVLYNYLDMVNNSAWGGTEWFSTDTAGNWEGVTVSGGHVTQIYLYFENTGGLDISDIDVSAFTYMTSFTLYIYGATSSPTGTFAWLLPDSLLSLYFYSNSTGATNSVTFDFDSWAIPAGIETFYIEGNSNIDISGNPLTNGLTGGYLFQFRKGTAVTGWIDDMLEYIYNNWSSFVKKSGTSYIRFYTDNLVDTVSGTYQDATPPTTGREFEYKLENDPDSTGNDIWNVQFT